MSKIQTNQKVEVNGHPGRVFQIHVGKLEGMAEVTLERGAVCVPMKEIKFLFEQSKEYFGRYICNADCTVTIRIEKRTPKMVTYTRTHTGEVERRKIKDFGKCEYIDEGPGLKIEASEIKEV